jgi:hypothetical protein
MQQQCNSNATTMQQQCSSNAAAMQLNAGLGISNVEIPDESAGACLAISMIHAF